MPDSPKSLRPDFLAFSIRVALFGYAHTVFMYRRGYV